MKKTITFLLLIVALTLGGWYRLKKEKESSTDNNPANNNAVAGKIEEKESEIDGIEHKSKIMLGRGGKVRISLKPSCEK